MILGMAINVDSEGESRTVGTFTKIDATNIALGSRITVELAMQLKLHQANLLPSGILAFTLVDWRLQVAGNILRRGGEVSVGMGNVKTTLSLPSVRGSAEYIFCNTITAILGLERTAAASLKPLVRIISITTSLAALQIK